MDETLKYMRSDTARSPLAKVRTRDDPRLAARMVALDGDPKAKIVRTVLIGVSDDRGIGLFGGRLGAIEGPQRFRDYFWRMHAPEWVKSGSILDAGDMVSAARTNETHARLTEVVDVLRDRFESARFVVVGGGHDHVFGELMGLVRWLKRSAEDEKALRIAHVCIDSRPNVHLATGEPHSGAGLRRLLIEPAARLDGGSLVVWGVQRAASADKHLAFLAAQGAKTVLWEDIERDPRAAAAELCATIASLGDDHDAVSISVDMAAFAQAVAPGVSEPTPVGVHPSAVLQAVTALGKLDCPTQLGIYELNPRYDRDGATARLAARIAWTYSQVRKSE